MKYVSSDFHGADSGSNMPWGPYQLAYWNPYADEHTPGQKKLVLKEAKALLAELPLYQELLPEKVPKAVGHPKNEWPRNPCSACTSATYLGSHPNRV